jgi:hypothetical protein
MGSIACPYRSLSLRTPVLAPFNAPSKRLSLLLLKTPVLAPLSLLLLKTPVLAPPPQNACPCSVSLLRPCSRLSLLLSLLPVLAPPGDWARLCDLEFSPDGQILATASTDTEIMRGDKLLGPDKVSTRLWDLSTGRERA